jgi:hypothetical protein
MHIDRFIPRWVPESFEAAASVIGQLEPFAASGAKIKELEDISHVQELSRCALTTETDVAGLPHIPLVATLGCRS